MAQSFDNRTWTLTGQPVALGEHVLDENFWEEFAVSANGVLVFQRAASDRIGQLTWFDRQGKVLGTVGEPAQYTQVRLSPDGTQAATVRGDLAHPDIWLVNLARGTSIRFTSDPVQKGDPVWSPDGSRIAFSQRGSGVVVKPSNGTGTQDVLFKSSQDLGLSSWSPDGRFLLYSVTDPKTRDDIWLLPVDGDRKPAVVLNSEFNETRARFSPDGRWISYSSDESGKYEVYVRSFEPPSGQGAPVVGAKSVISGCRGMFWLSDGKGLYCGSADNKLTAVEIATIPAFRAASPQPLAELPDEVKMIDTTADGSRHLAIVVQKASFEPYWVMLNWPALLKH